MPAALLEPGDLHHIFAGLNFDSPPMYLSVDAWTHAITDGQLDAPAPPPKPTFSKGLQDRPRVSFPAVPGATGYLFGASACSGEDRIFATPGWLSDGSMVDLEFPAVEDLPGWQSEWSSYGDTPELGYYLRTFGVVTSNLGTSTLYPPYLENDGVPGLGEDGLVLTTATVGQSECPGI
jgi:hypothetical protein